MRFAVVVVAAGLMLAPAVASAERDACARGTRWRGKPIDLDVKGASLDDVFRVLSDAGGINVVLADDVRGAVTVRLRRVPWDLALCTVAQTKQLRVTADGNVYLIRTRR